VTSFHSKLLAHILPNLRLPLRFSSADHNHGGDQTVLVAVSIGACCWLGLAR